MKKLITLFLSLVLVISMMVPAADAAQMFDFNPGGSSISELEKSSPNYFRRIRINGTNEAAMNSGAMLWDGYYYSAAEKAMLSESVTPEQIDSLFYSFDVDDFFQVEFFTDPATSTTGSGKAPTRLDIWTRGVNTIKKYKVEAKGGTGDWVPVKEGSLIRELCTASSAEELEDRAYCYTILFDKPVSNCVYLRFTIVELADPAKPAQISEVSVAVENKTAVSASNSNFIQPRIYAEGAGSFPDAKNRTNIKGVFANDTKGIFNLSANNKTYKKSTDMIYKSPYVYTYKVSGTDLSGVTNTDAIGSFWPGKSSDTPTTDQTVRIQGTSTTKLWYMVDMDVVGQVINQVHISPRYTNINGYTLKSSNDPAVWGDTTSDQWTTQVSGKCNYVSQNNVTKNEHWYEISNPTATRARYWLLEVTGTVQTNKSNVTKPQLYGVFLHEVPVSDMNDLAKEADATLKADLKTAYTLPSVSSDASFPLTWKVNSEAANGFSYTADAQDITLTVTSGNDSHTYTIADAIPAIGASFDGSKANGEALTYNAAINGINADTKVYFASYIADELVSVSIENITTSGFGFTAAHTLNASEAAATTIKAFLWEDGTLKPLTDIIPTK